jgi:hypothetical protein
MAASVKSMRTRARWSGSLLAWRKEPPHKIFARLFQNVVDLIKNISCSCCLFDVGNLLRAPVKSSTGVDDLILE